MPKKREGTSIWWYVFLIVLFLLLLKTFRVLPDPPEYLEIAAGAGAAVAVTGGLSWFHSQIVKIEHRLTKLEDSLAVILQRLAKIEAKLGIS